MWYSMQNDNKSLMGIILAGGEGVRLQRFVTNVYGYHRPKQYCTFTGTRSMFRHTIDRAAILIPHNLLFAVVNSHHREYVDEELKRLPALNIVEQPCLRDTSAGILFPLLKIEKINPDATVAIFPSDHFILDEKKFMNHVDKARQFVDENPKSIVLLGIKPMKKETGYGWIQPTRELYSDGEAKVFNVKKFIEKPDPGLINDLIRNGCMINSFVMVGKCSAFIKYISRCIPELSGAFQPIRNKFGTTIEDITVKRFYKYLPSVNFSKHVLEMIPNHLNVLEVNDVYWSDWGDEQRINRDVERMNRQYEPAVLAI